MNGTVEIRSFMSRFLLTYPELYDEMFRGINAKVPINHILREFVKKNEVEGGIDTSISPRPPVMYGVVWDYIVANEDIHAWWML